MVIKRDFYYSKTALISYYNNLKDFIGREIKQTEIASLLKEKYPDDPFYNSLDRKFATLKFYGFVYFDNNKIFRFNQFFGNYIEKLEQNIDASDDFINIIRTSKDDNYENSNEHFFILMTDLLKDKTIQYLDHIDIISYLQHYELINDYDELKKHIQNNRNKNFSEKVTILEDFYETNQLGELANHLHNAKYLFSFFENNGFYTQQNSLQGKVYYQDKTPRKLEDRRLFISKEFLNYTNGFDEDSIVVEKDYNADDINEPYESLDEEEIKTVDKSDETQKSVVKRYKTDRRLRVNALGKSGYNCELALIKGEEHTTFHSRRYDGNYAEVHHLIPMHAQENELFVKDDKLISLDQVSNLIVLCPICHAKLHYGKMIYVKPELELLFDSRREALKKNGLILNKEDLVEFYTIGSL